MPSKNTPEQSPTLAHTTVELKGYGHISFDSDEAINYANMRASQLSSLLMVIHGDGGESFRRYADEHQDNVLWLACSLAEELTSLIPFVREEAVASAASREDK